MITNLLLTSFKLIIYLCISTLNDIIVTSNNLLFCMKPFFYYILLQTCKILNCHVWESCIKIFMYGNKIPKIKPKYP